MTNILNELLASLEWHGEPVNALGDGLPHAEFDHIVSALPYRLPDEVRELYMWRNGTPSKIIHIVPYYTLMPLQESVEHVLRVYDSQYRRFTRRNASTPTWSPTEYPERLFPILGLQDRCFYSVQGLAEEEQTGIVFQDVIDEVPIPITTTLSGFFAAVLECWDTGVYRANPHPRADMGIYDSFLVDQKAQQRVFSKHSGTYS